MSAYKNQHKKYQEAFDSDKPQTAIQSASSSMQAVK